MGNRTSALTALHTDPRPPLLTYLPLCSIYHTITTTCRVQPAVSRLHAFPQGLLSHSVPLNCSLFFKTQCQDHLYSVIELLLMPYSDLLTTLYPFMTGLSLYSDSPQIITTRFTYIEPHSNDKKKKNLKTVSENMETALKHVVNFV